MSVGQLLAKVEEVTDKLVMGDLTEIKAGKRDLCFLVLHVTRMGPRIFEPRSTQWIRVMFGMD